MPSVSTRVAAFASALLAASFPVADSVAEETGLKLQRPVASVPRASRLPAPAFLSAQSIQGVTDKETIAQGEAQLRKGETSIAADWLRFNNENEELEARGNVRLEQEGAVITGPFLRYRMGDFTGEMDSPDFSIAPRARPGMQAVAARGRADRVEFEGEDKYRLVNTFFTTCEPGNDDWYLRVEELNLDYGREVGTASWAKIYFKGIPFIAAPYLDFALNNRRKSGFLPPGIGTTGKSGPEITVPYYFNLAPNRDFTFLPRYMAKRGLQFGGEYRYLEQQYNGVAKFEVLPEDQVRGGGRSALSLVHAYSRGPYIGGLNLNKVSDNDYFRDLSSRLSAVAQTYLPREGFLGYSGSWWEGGAWSAIARFQSFQTLLDPNNPAPIQYSRVPQIQFGASRPDIRGLDFGVSAELVDFHHPTQVIGVRTIVNPSLALPILTPGAFLTPKIGLHATSYSLSKTGPATRSSIRRSVPVFSTDAGLIFERDSDYFGQTFLQTLEPRAYYLHVPYRDQNQIPIFDTAVADFNYAQIFSENSFSGGDRMNDAHQVTFALTSRLLAPASGQEALRATVAQRYYLRDQRVTLTPTATPRIYRESDWLGSVAGRIAPRWTLESAVQYNPRESRPERLTIATRYQPEVHKTLNMSYRYLREQFTQFDVSAQWPLSGSWYAVGRYNYSLRDHRVIESLAGFEYNGGCWIGRVVVQRFAAAAGVATNAVFLQLELNGFSRIGSNPLEVLKRNIPGYTRINQLVAPGRAFDFEN